jgi:transcriptional regulator NrdR family protein
MEQLSEGWLRVRKSDGRIVSFSRAVVLRSLRGAAIRKYDPARLNQLIDAVIKSVYPTSSDVIVDSRVVGEALLAQFRRLDSPVT